jgi:RNA polymerase sigma-70 factor (ECF subfamily)
MFLDDSPPQLTQLEYSPRNFPETELVSLIPAMRAFSRTFCRNNTDADDLIQETLTRALASAHRFEPGTRLKSWLFTIMRNTFLTSAKRYARECPGADDCVSSLGISLPSQEWSQRSREVGRAIDKLPTDQREVIVLVAMAGFGYEEAAEICGCAVGTIKSRLNRGRQQLQELLGDVSEAIEKEPVPRNCSASSRSKKARTLSQNAGTI